MHFKIKIVKRTFESKMKARSKGIYYIALCFVWDEDGLFEKRRGVVTLGDDTDWWHSSKE